MKNELDEKYRLLFRHTGLGDSDLQVLHTRIINELHKREPVIEQSDKAISARRQFYIPALKITAYAAAATLLAACVWHWLCTEKPGPSADMVIASKVVSPMEISDTTEMHSAFIFNELEDIFGDHLDWAYESNGQMHMGIRPGKSTTTIANPPMLVRLKVLQRDSDQQWHNYLQTDIMVRGGQFTEIVSAAHPGMSLHLWVTPVADDQAAVDTALFIKNGTTLASYLNAVIPEGQPHEMARKDCGEGVYRVFQTIHRINEPAG